MKKFYKELMAIVVGILAGAFFKWEFSSIIGYLKDRDLFKMEYVPYDFGQMLFAIMVAWLLMGIFRVSWLEKWIKITKIVCGFMIPFTLISVATVYVNESLWDSTIYWIIDVAVSAIFAVKMFKTPISAEG